MVEVSPGLWDAGKTRTNLEQGEYVIAEVNRIISLVYSKIRNDAALFDPEKYGRGESGQVDGPTQLITSSGQADKPDVKEASSMHRRDKTTDLKMSGTKILCQNQQPIIVMICLSRTITNWKSHAVSVSQTHSVNTLSDYDCVAAPVSDAYSVGLFGDSGLDCFN